MTAIFYPYDSVQVTKLPYPQVFSPVVLIYVFILIYVFLELL